MVVNVGLDVVLKRREPERIGRGRCPTGVHTSEVLGYCTWLPCLTLPTRMEVQYSNLQASQSSQSQSLSEGGGGGDGLLAGKLLH